MNEQVSGQVSEEEIIRIEFQNILDKLVSSKIRPTATEIISARQPMVQLFEELMYKLDKLQRENQELKDLKAELQAEVIKNQHLENKLKVYEQQIDLEWVEENYIEKRILKRAEKIIDLMAEQMSKRPLMIFQGNENSVRILKEPKEIIDYYTKKAEE